MLEWIVESRKEAITAEKLGARRLELVSANEVGGLTPSPGLIGDVLGYVAIDVQVMVRPHPYGFVYDDYDKEVMIFDIAFLSDLGHERIVIGALQPAGMIDTAFLDRLFEEFPDLDVTFQRAFDRANDQLKAYETLLDYRKNIKRVLTSGGAENCADGIDTLERLVELQKVTDGPIIMPGSGLSAKNIKEIHERIGADEYHFGSGVRENRSFENGFDEEAVKQIIDVLE